VSLRSPCGAVCRVDNDITTRVRVVPGAILACSLKERTDVLDDPLCFPRRPWCRDLDVRTYDEINIAVDIADGASSEPMWRGVASEPQAGEGRTQRQVERMMKKLFRKYPPKG
jgi:hypothetical protein